jgi:tetratricopeptide (TPR) repeat protein
MLESSLAAYVSEIMQGILTLGPDWALSGPGLVILSDETPAAVATAVEELLVRLTDRAAGGDAVARDVLSLTGPAGEAWQPGMIAGCDTGAVLAAAGRAAEAGDRQGAARLAALLTTVEESAADGFLALAALAAEAASHDIAIELGTRALELSPGHPRAHVIIGYGQFKKGQSKAAQNNLASATRLARRRPEMRADQRAAQQLLLLLHLT